MFHITHVHFAHSLKIHSADKTCLLCLQIIVFKFPSTEYNNMTMEVAKKRPATKDKSHSPHKKPKFDGKPGKFKPKPTGKKLHFHFTDCIDKLQNQFLGALASGKKPTTFNKFKGPAPKATVAGADKAPEKQDWNKFKQDKKDLKLKRKKDCNDLFELTVEGKKIYEELKW